MKQRQRPNLVPNTSSDAGSPSAHPAHGPAPRYSPAEASPAEEQSPSRSRAPRRGPSKRRQSPSRASLLQPGPLQGLGTGETPPRSRLPSADWGGGPTTRRDGHINSPTTPQHGAGSDGVSWRRPPCRTADVTGVPSDCARHCDAILGAGQICGALCGLV